MPTTFGCAISEATCAAVWVLAAEVVEHSATASFLPFQATSGADLGFETPRKTLYLVVSVEMPLLVCLQDETDCCAKACDLFRNSKPSLALA